MTKLSEHVETNSTADFVEWINYVAFDIIGDLTWGSSLDCLDGLRYHPWIQTVSQFKAAAVVGATKFYPSLYPLLVAITPASALKDVMEMWKVTEEKVRHRVASGDNGRPDLVGTILASQKILDVAPMTEEELEVNAMLVVAAGSESITTVLVVVKNYLLRSPNKMESLVTEIRASFRSQEEITGAPLKQIAILERRSE